MKSLVLVSLFLSSAAFATGVNVKCVAEQNVTTYANVEKSFDIGSSQMTQIEVFREDTVPAKTSAFIAGTPFDGVILVSMVAEVGDMVVRGGDLLVNLNRSEETATIQLLHDRLGIITTTCEFSKK